jgi:ribosomal protein RSM22 (predicted rRNA methylase)
VTSPDLPAELKTALLRRTEGLSRSDAAMRAASQSQIYRGGGSSKTIATEEDALAYALARMPATYAAVVASLNAVAEVLPDFAPATLLDVGAGPGTATWAATEVFPALQRFAQIDSNPALRALALDLIQDTALSRRIDYALGAAGELLARADKAELVVTSYVLGEIEESERAIFAERLWDSTGDLLLVVEPGTPAGYQRILALRTQLVQKGAHVAAPCPHDHACPLIAPDWCHFSQRLARSRAHKQIKSASVPFEDEKFIYAAFSRRHVATRAPRVLSQPAVNKGAVGLKLCTPDALLIASVPRQNKESYARAKKLRWGDATFDLSKLSME